MISRQEFETIDQEVKDALEEAFNYLKTKCVDHNYILFLAEGDYKEEHKTYTIKLNPYAIDDREDRLKDRSRHKFFIEFMKTFYSFPHGKEIVIEDEFRYTMELMVYTHVWESKPFLRQLYRLASLACGKSYPWQVVVPEMGKHLFIREEIRNVLKSKHLKLATVISKGFHTSLRNAFAHSEYQFDDYHKAIFLDTYKGGAWDIRSLSYNDWAKRFTYTALLSYHYLNIKHQNRQSLPEDFGKSEYLIVHPRSEKSFQVCSIFYNSHYDRFSFHK